MSRLVPSAIETLGNRHVLAIAMGREHTIVLTDEGVVLSFGYGGFGALGHGDKENQLTPKVVEALRGRRVVAISAGAKQSLVFTDDGAVLSCGSRGNGFLGCQYEMKVVEALRDVRWTASFATRRACCATRTRRASSRAICATITCYSTWEAQRSAVSTRPDVSY